MEYLINEKVNKSLLYASYKAFYGKEPDFKEENRMNITIEMQAMAYLLERYRAVIGNYRFAYHELSDLYMPISMQLQDLLVGMLNHENEEFIFSNCCLKPELEAKIKLIGTTIMQSINKKENPINALRLLCSIYYTNERIMPLATVEQMKEFNQCSIEEIEEAKELQSILRQV